MPKKIDRLDRERFLLLEGFTSRSNPESIMFAARLVGSWVLGQHGCSPPDLYYSDYHGLAPDILKRRAESHYAVNDIDSAGQWVDWITSAVGGACRLQSVIGACRARRNELAFQAVDGLGVDTDAIVRVTDFKTLCVADRSVGAIIRLNSLHDLLDSSGTPSKCRSYTKFFYERARAFRDAAAGVRLFQEGDWCFYGAFQWELSATDLLLDEDVLQASLIERIRRDDARGRRLVNVVNAEVQGRQSQRAIAEAVRMFVWRRDDGKCVNCGSRMELEFDHVIPVARGGSSTARNVQLLCAVCNRRKSDTI